MKVSAKKKAARNPQYRAEFAVRQGVDADAPYLEGVILKNDESWHDAVRGNGGSYSPNLTDKEIPADIIKAENESLEAFKQRIRQIERAW